MFASLVTVSLSVESSIEECLTFSDYELLRQYRQDKYDKVEVELNKVSGMVHRVRRFSFNDLDTVLQPRDQTENLVYVLNASSRSILPQITEVNTQITRYIELKSTILHPLEIFPLFNDRFWK